MPRPPPPPLAPALPPFGPLAGPLARAKPPARSPHSLSLTSQPSLSRAPFTGRPAPPVSRVISLAYGAPPSLPSPSPRRPLAVPSPHRESSAPPRPPRLTNVLTQYRPAVESCRRRCAALMPALCASPAPPSSAAPLPSGAYKKVAPGTSFPAPASATTLLPSPVSSPPRLSLPLRWSSEQLSEPSSFLTMPRTQSTTSPPQSLTQRPPVAILDAELCHLPVDSPLPTPSSQIKPTPRIASPCPC
jgi:hypothetical protein